VTDKDSEAASIDLSEDAAMIMLEDHFPGRGIEWFDGSGLEKRQGASLVGSNPIPSAPSYFFIGKSAFKTNSNGTSKNIAADRVNLRNSIAVTDPAYGFALGDCACPFSHTDSRGCSSECDHLRRPRSALGRSDPMPPLGKPDALLRVRRSSRNGSTQTQS
jgi:hypothetical protein